MKHLSGVSFLGVFWILHVGKVPNAGNVYKLTALIKAIYRKIFYWSVIIWLVLKHQGFCARFSFFPWNILENKRAFFSGTVGIQMMEGTPPKNCWEKGMVRVCH